MCGKIKPVLKERGSELPRQKSRCPKCFFCHPQIVLAEVSQDKREKNGDKTIMVPRLQGKKKKNVRRNQCNAIKPDMF
jgi:hypothetical protein